MARLLVRPFFTSLLPLFDPPTHISKKDPLLLLLQNALPALHRPPTNPRRVLPLPNPTRACSPRPRVPDRRGARTAPHARIRFRASSRTHALGLHNRQRDRTSSRLLFHHRRCLFFLYHRRRGSVRTTGAPLERLGLRTDTDARYALAYLRTCNRRGWNCSSAAATQRCTAAAAPNAGVRCRWRC